MRHCKRGVLWQLIFAIVVFLSIFNIEQSSLVPVEEIQVLLDQKYNGDAGGEQQPEENEGSLSSWKLSSPSSSSSISFELIGPSRCLHYSIQSGQDDVIASSELLFSDVDAPPKQLCGLRILLVEEEVVDDTWRPVFGQRSTVRNHYNGIRVTLGRKGTSSSSFSSTPGVLRIDARAYEAGVAFRVVLLGAAGSVLVSKSQRGSGHETSLVFSAAMNLDVGVEGTIYRDLSLNRGFETRRLSEKVKKAWVDTLPMHPFAVKYDNDVYFAFTEASNTEFKPVYFTAEGSFQSLTASFQRVDVLPPVGDDLPTPWFTFIIGRSPRDLVERSDDLVYNLNEPCTIEDPSWIRVGKVLRDTLISTASSKAAIDLAGVIGFQFILIDVGWYGPGTEAASDATKWVEVPRKDPFDLREVISYGQSKGVGIFLYVNDIALRRQFDEIVPLYASWGVAGIKFDSVEVPSSSQDTARLMYYVKKCAEHRLLVNIHAHFRPSGYSRTYPNLVSIKGIRGDGSGETPAHGMVLPFVRLLGGIADHTFVFDEERLAKMNKTLTHQISLAVIFYNPLQHIFWYRDPWGLKALFASLPVTLRHLEVWRDMPTTWDESKLIEGSIGEYIVMARRDAKGIWFLAAATKAARSVTFRLDFLTPGLAYEAQVYRDSPEFPTMEGTISSFPVSGEGELSHTADLLDGGGEIVVFRPTSVPSTVAPTVAVTSAPTVAPTVAETPAPSTNTPTVAATTFAPTIQAAPKRARPEASIEALDLLPTATGEGDSTVLHFKSDPRKYSVCSIRNVCIDAEQVYLIVEDPVARAELTSLVPLCRLNDPKMRPIFCRCITRSLVPVFVESAKEIGEYTFYSGHTWISDHWVIVHHIGHWVEKMVQFHSIFLDAESYGLPEIDRIAFIKSPPMNEAEKFFYEIGTGNLGYTIPEPPLFNITSPICLEEASVTKISSTIATSQDDMMAFRETTNKMMGTDLQILKGTETSCPPPKTFILTRSEPVDRLRRILNQEEIIELLKSRMGLVDISVVTTNGNMSVSEQADIFGQFGLMLSSHSSQLVFSIFSSPSSAIIEVAPALFNFDFSDLAQMAGPFYQFALGGKVPNATSTDYVHCNDQYPQCQGNPDCMKEATTCSKHDVAEVKRMDFEADVNEVLTTVGQAIKHLHQACGGHWDGVRR